MDHRCGERRALSTIVLLRRRGWTGWIVGEMRDISISGAWLHVPRHHLPVHAQVRLEAPWPGGQPGRLMHCTAMVARVERDGVGLVFDELAPASLAPLLGLRNRAPAEASA